MVPTATHAWHCHTVSGDRWLILKAEYSHRCGERLGREHEASETRLAVQAAEAALLPMADSHLPHR